jgi:hypothetical protein
MESEKAHASEMDALDEIPRHPAEVKKKSRAVYE